MLVTGFPSKVTGITNAPTAVSLQSVIETEKPLTSYVRSATSTFGSTFALILGSTLGLTFGSMLDSEQAAKQTTKAARTGTIFLDLGQLIATKE